MNSDMVGGLIRWAVGGAATWAAAKGYVDGQSAQAIAAGVVSLAMAVWSVFSNKTGKVIGTAK